MPRREINNPTNRILRLLDDLSELEAAYLDMANRFANCNQDEYEKCSPMPRLIAYNREQERQQLMGQKTIAARDSKRRQRLRSKPVHQTTRSTSSRDANDGRLSQSDIEKAVRAIDATADIDEALNPQKPPSKVQELPQVEGTIGELGIKPDIEY